MLLRCAGFWLQCAGFVSVGACLAAGIVKGDYGYLELGQFVAGSAAFYLGCLLRRGAG